MKTKELAALLYARYCASVGGVAHDGKTLPGWKDFRADPTKRKQSDAWMDVADQVLKLAHEGGTGAGLIAMERERQMTKEGWSADHDDKEHSNGALAVAGACYASMYAAHHGAELRWHSRENQANAVLSIWPFDPQWFKPTPDDPIRQLTKAGALIAAEIDRLQRKKALEVGKHAPEDNAFRPPKQGGWEI